MKLIEDKKKCCGCSACYNVCPVGAIKMQEDEYGYIYPEINHDKCINCGLCKKTCVYQNKEKKLYTPTKTYAAFSNNNDLISKSASGGIFASLAVNVLEDCGIVYGSAMEYIDNKLKVKHIRVDNKEDLIKLQGSKYVQSDMKETFPLIKYDLENGKTVLFSGTPCQVHSLKSYLKFKEYKNLFTIDIICHGVPNNKMFNDYIKLLENKYSGKIIDFKFRDKSKRWGRFLVSLTIKDDNKVYKEYIDAFNSSYYQLFLDSEIYRENCYECPYARKERIGDITIGDFWDIELEHPEYIKNKKIEIDKGISCIIVNSDNGNELMDKYGKDIIILPSQFDKVAKHNAQLCHPSRLKISRNKILELYKSNEFKQVDKYYKRKNLVKNFIKKIKHLI